MHRNRGVYVGRETPTELWRPIPGCPGYEASNFGRIKSIPRFIPSESHTSNHGGLNLNKTRILKQGWRSRGYLFFVFQLAGHRKIIASHRAVWSAFNDTIPAGLVINHKDLNKKNNTLENLEVCTPRENTDHAIAAGIYGHGRNRGENNPASKLSNADRLMIYVLIRQGIPRKDLVKKFRVSKTTIANICNKKGIYD